MAVLNFDGGEDGRPLSFGDYNNLLSDYQQETIFPFMTDNWGGNVNGPDRLPPTQANLDAQKKATEAFWGQYSPQIRSDFQRHMNDSREWTDSVLPLMKMIPLAVGGAGLGGALGLLGPGAGFPGTSMFGGGGLGSLFGGAEAAVAPTWDAATSAAWGSGAGLGGDTLSAMGMGNAAAGAAAGAPWAGLDSTLYPGAANGSSVMTGAEAGTGGGGNMISNFIKGLTPGSVKEGFNLTKSLASLAGIYNNYKTSKGLTSLANDMAGMYKPGSSYEEQLRKELQRRDAMSGRRSQYGPRAVELQARLAEMATRQSPKLAEMYMMADNSRNDMYKSLLNFGNSSGLLGLFGG